MDLILWRHAEAQPEQAGLGDLERPLTAKGARQAERMAGWLNQRLPQTTRIIASPALRCQQTVHRLERPFKTLPALAPGGTGDALLKATRWPDADEPVLVVGHQPTIGLIAALLLTETPQAWAIKKGAVWWLRNRDREGSAQVVLQAVMSPDCL